VYIPRIRGISDTTTVPETRPRGGLSGGHVLVQSGNMPKKVVSPPPNSDSGIAKELEYLNSQLAAVEALIRALEQYKQFYPRLVARRSKTA